MTSWRCAAARGGGGAEVVLVGMRRHCARARRPRSGVGDFEEWRDQSGFNCIARRAVRSLLNWLPNEGHRVAFGGRQVIESGST